MEHMIPVILFVLATTITPGPNTIMAMATGLGFGMVKSIPLILGISSGFALMIFMVGIGLGQVFIDYPALNLLLKIVGVVYIYYLAWEIANNPIHNRSLESDSPPGFFKGLLFQWVNIKAWVVSVSAVSAFTGAGDETFAQTLILTSAFLFTGIPCVALWVLFGSTLKQYLTNHLYVRMFNLSMALLLALSVTPVMFDIWQLIAVSLSE